MVRCTSTPERKKNKPILLRQTEPNG